MVQSILDAGDGSNDAGIVGDLAISKGNVEVDTMRPEEKEGVLSLVSAGFIIYISSAIKEKNEISRHLPHQDPLAVEVDLGDDELL